MTSRAERRLPKMRQKLRDAAGRLRWQSLHDVAKVLVGVVSIEPCQMDQGHGRRGPLAGAKAAREQPVRSSDRDRTDLVLHSIVVTGHIAVAQVVSERRPSPEAVVDGLCRR